MAEVIRRTKALSVSPLKVSQPVGAALAVLGLDGAMPLMHGSQGCTAFAKVFFVRHFREPIPLQTTAMDQVSAVMGADGSIVEALATICKKSNPKLVGLVSTGLSEAQGCDLRGAVRAFREQHPEYARVRVVAVNTPDFSGCLETGYASAVLELLKEVNPEPVTAPNASCVNVLASSMLTPGDIEELEDFVEEFGLSCRIVPNLAGSLGGELTDVDFSPVSIGGTDVAEVERLGDAAATLVIGRSLNKAASWLEQKTGVRSLVLPHLHSLAAVDRLTAGLLQISGKRGPTLRVVRQRRQLTDAMLDTHFSLGQRRFAIAGDADLLLALTELVQSMGATVVAAVAPSAGEALAELPLERVQLGDLEDLEHLARGSAQVLLANSHAAETAQRLGVPLVRVGFPLFDTIGAYARRWIGYRGVRQTLFDLANTVHQEALDEVVVYRARHSLKVSTG
jgi:nitrogenase molybdenum-iron protein NifN